MLSAHANKQVGFGLMCENCIKAGAQPENDVH